MLVTPFLAVRTAVLPHGQCFNHQLLPMQVGVGRHNPRRYLPAHEDDAGGQVEDRFEVAAHENGAAQQDVVYGLNQARRRPESADAAAANGERMHVGSREWEARQFREDMETLAEEADEDAYQVRSRSPAHSLRHVISSLACLRRNGSPFVAQAMPVEAFGEAMLRGMGWQEGKGVGRNAKTAVQAIEYVPRQGRLGLGADPGAPADAKKKKYIKPGENREGKPDMVYVNADGQQKHVKTLDDKLVARPKAGVQPGKQMRVRDRRRRGTTVVSSLSSLEGSVS